MKQLVMVPDGWPCKLMECRPGFFVFRNELCLKDEYGASGNSYCSSGEIFSGGTSGIDKLRQDLIVQPVKAVWEEDE